MKKATKLNFDVQIDEWTELINLLHVKEFVLKILVSQLPNIPPPFKGIIKIIAVFTWPEYIESLSVNIQHFWNVIFRIIPLNFPFYLLKYSISLRCFKRKTMKWQIYFIVPFFLILSTNCIKLIKLQGRTLKNSHLIIWYTYILICLKL